MKTKFIYLLCIFIAGSSGLLAQSKTIKANLTVRGNCVMCKDRIEAALDHPGIKFAEWSPETKNLEVLYNSHKVSEKQIHALIAAAGHDTDSVKAPDEVYSKLPFCCLYRHHDHSNIKGEEHHHAH